MNWKQAQDLRKEIAKIAGVNYLEVQVSTSNDGHEQRFADVNITKNDNTVTVQDKLAQAGYYGHCWQRGGQKFVSVSLPACVTEPQF